MILNSSISAERVHIGFFGLRNAGKSSLVNAVTNQQLSIVSDTPGTTTDPVSKAMELLPLGPVVIIDTPGIDDIGELGKMRVKRAKDILAKTDICVLVVDAKVGCQSADNELIKLFNDKQIPYIIAYNKCDLAKTETAEKNEILVSAKESININELKDLIASLVKGTENKKKLVGGIIGKDDIAVLVTPIDESAPKGRLILPQQQTIRDILDNDGINIVVKDTNLDMALKSLAKKPKIVITDSQAFEKVDKIVPKDIPLTSFSILFARYKGELDDFVSGAKAIENLKDGDKILVCEGCTHHRQCGDIGTQKIPMWLNNYCKKNLQYDFASGMDFSDSLTDYALIIHCGGCMLTEKEMHSRLAKSKSAGVPIINYGILISKLHGILDRAIAPFNLQ